MLVFECAEGLVVKSRIDAGDYVTVYTCDKRVYAWIGGVKISMEPISKPPCEYTWNELNDLHKTMQGMLAMA